MPAGCPQGAHRVAPILRHRPQSAHSQWNPSTGCAGRCCPHAWLAGLAGWVCSRRRRPPTPHTPGPPPTTRRHGRVLVHCFAGQSRSAALTMAYLMAREGLGLLDAWAVARAARPCARPNPGFLAQLAAFGQELGLPGSREDAEAVEGLDLTAL